MGKYVRTIGYDTENSPDQIGITIDGEAIIIKPVIKELTFYKHN